MKWYKKLSRTLPLYSDFMGRSLDHECNKGLVEREKGLFANQLNAHPMHYMVNTKPNISLPTLQSQISNLYPFTKSLIYVAHHVQYEFKLFVLLIYLLP